MNLSTRLIEDMYFYTFENICFEQNKEKYAQLFNNEKIVKNSLV